VPPVPPTPADRAAADAAFDACLRAARAVGALTEARAHAAAVARREWRGPTRDRFDDESLRLDADAASLIGRLLAAAAAIEAGG
jgi:hypothetical protein